MFILTLRRGLLTLASLTATLAATAQTPLARAPHPTRERYFSTHHPVAARPTTAQDQLTQALTQYWGGGMYYDSTRLLYPRYNAAGQTLERVTEDRVGRTSWVMRQRRTVQYINGRDVNDTIFSNLNRPLFAIKRTYTAVGKPDTVYTRFSPTATTWRNSRRDWIVYDINNFKAEEYQQDWLFTSYINTGRYLFTTDGQGRVVTEEFQQTDLSGANYLNTTLSTLTYPGTSDSLGTAIVSAWSDVTNSYSELQNRYRNVYKTGMLLDSVYAEQYNATNSSWDLQAITTYTYDNRQNRLSETVKTGTSLATMAPYLRRLYTYRIITGTPAESPVTDAGLTLAPNPATANGIATLRYTLATPATVTVELLDLLGRRVATPALRTTQTAGNQAVAVDLRGLSAGLYVARLTTGNTHQQVKLVVQ